MDACELTSSRPNRCRPSINPRSTDLPFAVIPDADGAPLAGVVRAGDAMRPLPPGGALRVMTGAPLPFGADRVAMQEQCQRSGERVFPPPLAAGANVRRRGEDVAPGDLLARAGTRLDARHVALFAASGHVTVPCLRPLRVAMLATGDELSDRPSDAANSGLIRELEHADAGGPSRLGAGPGLRVPALPRRCRRADGTASASVASRPISSSPPEGCPSVSRTTSGRPCSASADNSGSRRLP